VAISAAVASESARCAVIATTTASLLQPRQMLTHRIAQKLSDALLTPGSDPLRPAQQRLAQTKTNNLRETGVTHTRDDSART
jgi:hypothetical protein